MEFGVIVQNDELHYILDFLSAVFPFKQLGAILICMHVELDGEIIDGLVQNSFTSNPFSFYLFFVAQEDRMRKTNVL